MRRYSVHREDPLGLSQAAEDFNNHSGPARIFYNRNTQVFFTRTYPFGQDRFFGPLTDGLDIVELYRKTSSYPDVKVTKDELKLMEMDVGPYSEW